MKKYSIFFVVFSVFLLIAEYSEAQRSVNVKDSSELRTAVLNAVPGDMIVIEQGFYKEGFSIDGLSGTEDLPIIISGKDLQNPPVFSGIGECFKLRSCSYIKLANIKIADFSSNSINIDDSGKNKMPSHHIILDNISIFDTGKGGNQDSIKISGADNFIIKNCSLNGWGGSGIDMVGCHRGIVEYCLIQGKTNLRNKNGIQIKGGSSYILVQNNVFLNCGTRALNIGGMTGKRYFRPFGVDYEAKNIIVAGSKFIGGEAHIAWVTSINTYVHHNIFYLPEKFVGRILQETKDKKFVTCQKGLFEKNLVVTDPRVNTYFNVGVGTSPETFVFRGNAWYRFGSEEKPFLPVRESDGVYNVYPDLADFGTPEMRITSGNKKLIGIGPNGYIPHVYSFEFKDINFPEIKKIEQNMNKKYFGQLIIGIFILFISFLIVVSRFIKRKAK
jgi:hypothetical protein